MSQKILVTGGNRGIGLEIVNRLVARGDEVIVLSRRSSSGLDALGIRVLEGVDVGDLDSIRSVREVLSGQIFDAVWNVAGILSDESIDALDASAVERISRQFLVNSLGPMMVSSTFLDQVRDGGKIVMLTSRMGSISDNDSGGRYGYRASKAALNAMSKSLAIDVKGRGISVGIFHPGWVQTEMTGGTGNLSAGESAGLLIERFDELSLESSGAFVHANGEVLPW